MHDKRTRVHVADLGALTIAGVPSPYYSSMAEDIFKNGLHCRHAQNKKYLLQKEEYFQIIANPKATEGTNISLTMYLDSTIKSLYNSEECGKI